MSGESVITAFAVNTYRKGSVVDIVAVAVDEDGQVLAQHVSSSISWAMHDLGVGRKEDAWRSAFYDNAYDRRYPDGWVVEWVDDPGGIRRITPDTEERVWDTQPLPDPNDSTDIQSMVIADIHARRELGRQRYGTPLQAHNGRDMLLDAYEEALDLACYLKGVIVERDGGATP